MTDTTPAALTPEELAGKLQQIAETHAKATGGIWHSHGGYLSTRPNITRSIYDLNEMGQQTLSSPFQAVPFYRKDDASFCASAHQDVPWLVELAQSQARQIEAQRAEIERLKAENAALGVRHGIAKARATTAEAALAAMTSERDKEEAVALELIDQRDAAENALGKLFAMVTGRPPEWSNLFGYSEAMDECEEALSTSLERERGMREALTMFTKARYQIANSGPANTWSLDRLHEAWVKACDCLPTDHQEGKS
ncbi:hypothetical protein ABMY26_07160 (plasmid) [Azospirillum sp. HJ39]|uniref:hypothetical protein n=1 Tax=Azospirillum sp. HJ39 TaxID=3159496 RepID=UPI003557C6FB